MKVLLVIGAGGLMAAVPDPNIVLNIVMLVVLLFGAPRYFKSKEAQAQLDEKDRVIATKQQTIIAQEERIESLCTDLDGARGAARAAIQKANEYESLARTWEARYEEQGRYTAKGAVEALESSLEKMESHLTELETALTTAVASQGELTLKVLEVLAKIEGHLRPSPGP